MITNRLLVDAIHHRLGKGPLEITGGGVKIPPKKFLQGKLF